MGSRQVINHNELHDRITATQRLSNTADRRPQQQNFCFIFCTFMSSRKVGRPRKSCVNIACPQNSEPGPKQAEPCSVCAKWKRDRDYHEDHEPKTHKISERQFQLLSRLGTDEATQVQSLDRLMHQNNA